MQSLCPGFLSPFALTDFAQPLHLVQGWSLATPDLLWHWHEEFFYVMPAVIQHWVRHLRIQRLISVMFSQASVPHGSAKPLRSHHQLAFAPMITKVNTHSKSTSNCWCLRDFLIPDPHAEQSPCRKLSILRTAIQSARMCLSSGLVCVSNDATWPLFFSENLFSFRNH